MGTPAAAVAIGKVVGAFVVKAVASIVASQILNQMLAPSQHRRQSNLQQQGIRGIKLNTLSTDAPLKVVYGELRVGGNDVYRHLAGSSNRQLWAVQTIAEGECDSISSIKLGDRDISAYGSDVSYTFYSGSATQTYDTNLHAVDSRWTDNYRYTAYIVWKFIYDENKFQSLPDRTVLLKGKKVYDFRDGSTAWSDNPVLCLYDFMTNSRYGLGFDSSMFDIASGGTWESAANYCDTKGWTLNLAIDDSKSGVDWVLDILTQIRSTLRWWDGKFYLHYADLNYESSVMDIKDEHIVQDGSGKATISIEQPRMLQKPDIVRVAFIRSDKEYTTDYLMIGDVEGAVRDLELSGVTSRDQAATIGTYWLERWKLDRRIKLLARDDCVQLEEGDPVTITSSALAISDQQMRVVESTYQGSGLINLTLQYDSLTLYNDYYDINEEAVYTTTLPDPTDEPPSVGNVSQTEEVYDYRGRSFTRLKVSFDAPSDYPWFSHVEVWQSFDDTTYTHLFNVTDDFEIDPVDEGKTYYLILRTVSIWGTKQDLNNAQKISRTIQGKTDAPSSLAALYAIVNANTINLYAEKVSDPDIELYEFRLGSSWSGSIFLGAFRAPNLSLYGVKPGSYTFFCNTLANNGEYGDTPRSASASLQDPPDGWTLQHTETCNYSIGTFSNTEQTTYSSEYYLKCSHTGGSFTGTYTSPIYNLGASGRYMVYVLADIVVTGEGTTWDSQLTAGTSWDSQLTAGESWSQVFGLPSGPQVKMTLYYGDTSPPLSYVEKMEILSAIVTGRYFQVKIEITDPNDQINALVENFTLKFCQ